MQIGVYKSSGGKDIVLHGNYSPEGKAKILLILQILQSGDESKLITRIINKNSTPKLYEIKKDKIRIFYFKEGSKMYITHILENKQKNKTELLDKEKATKRIGRMLNDEEQYVEWL